MKEDMLKDRLRERAQHAHTTKKHAEELNEDEIGEIIHDKDLEETETPMDDKKKSAEDMTKIWEESMHDFVPEEFITFELNEGQSVMLLEKIHHTK